MDCFWNVKWCSATSKDIDQFHSVHFREELSTQVTSTPAHTRPENVVQWVEEITAKRKQHWAEEKPKFDNARKLRAVSYFDPEDKEFNENWQKREVGKAHGLCNTVSFWELNFS